MNFDKSLASGTTPMLLLKLLSEKDRYGYEIIETLKRHSNGAFDLKAGTLYPLLHNLEVKNWVCVNEHEVNGKVRKYYHITDEGLAVLEEKQREWNVFVRCVKSVLKHISIQKKNGFHINGLEWGCSVEQVNAQLDLHFEELTRKNTVNGSFSSIIREEDLFLEGYPLNQIQADFKNYGLTLMMFDIKAEDPELAFIQLSDSFKRKFGKPDLDRVNNYGNNLAYTRQWRDFEKDKTVLQLFWSNEWLNVAVSIV